MEVALQIFLHAEFRSRPVPFNLVKFVKFLKYYFPRFLYRQLLLFKTHAYMLQSVM